MVQKIVEHWALIASVLLGISETLALIPSLKQNGILQGLIVLLKELKAKKPE